MMDSRDLLLEIFLLVVPLNIKSVIGVTFLNRISFSSSLSIQIVFLFSFLQIRPLKKSTRNNGLTRGATQVPE